MESDILLGRESLIRLQFFLDSVHRLNIAESGLMDRLYHEVYMKYRKGRNKQYQVFLEQWREDGTKK